MTTRLVQKRFLKGTREFEILDDVVNVEVRSALSKERVSVGLATLDPEPVVNKPYLQFNSRAGGSPVLSLFLDEPNSEEFNAFVDALKLRVVEQQNTGGGVAGDGQPAGLGGNSFDEPPKFAEPGEDRLRHVREFADPGKLADAIRVLETYGVSDDVPGFIAALEALQKDPENETCMVQLLEAFEELGIRQGAVLTYAPYISILLAGKPY